MIIRVKYNGKIISVDVSHGECRKYKCFYPHKWRTQAIGNNIVQEDKNWSCGTRNYHGCPSVKEAKKK
jgi:hypothetical protein